MSASQRASQRRMLDQIEARLQAAGAVGQREMEGRRVEELTDGELMTVINRDSSITDEALIALIGTRPGLPGAIILVKGRQRP